MAVEQKSAEILVVGNELLNGTTLDTNSFWLSKKLNKVGVRVERKTTIRDRPDTISETFEEALNRKPDWLFSIGGLGPTYDDMTIRGLARAIHRKFGLNQVALTMLKESYKRRGRQIRRLSKSSIKMAMMPTGATPLSNTVGSAPGVYLQKGKTNIVALPGVPLEMRQIFLKQVFYKLKELSAYSSAEHWIKIAGLGESRLAPEVSRQYQIHKKRLYIKSHPRGFEDGKPVLDIQIILETPKSELAKGKRILNDVSSSIFSYATKLGATAHKMRSV